MDWNRKKARRVVSITVLALLSACGGGDGSPTAPPPPPPPPPPAPPPNGNLVANVRVIDSTVSPLVSDSADRAAGVLKFMSSSGDTSIVVGRIIAGAQGEGFLRHVTSVSKSGDTVVAHTTLAGVDEAVTEGHFSADLEGPPAFSDRPPPNRLPAARRASATDVDGITLTGSGLRLEDAELYRDASLVVKVPTGQEIDIGSFHTFGTITLGQGWTTFESVAFSGFSTKLDAEVDGLSGGTISREIPAGHFEQSFRDQMGRMPIVGSFRVDFYVDFNATVQAGDTLRAHLDLNSSISQGVELQNGSWVPIYERQTDFAQSHPDTTYPKTGSITMSLRPVVTLRLFGEPGPTTTLIPYLDYETQAMESWHQKETGGLDVVVGGAYGNITHAIPTFSQRVKGDSVTLFETPSSGSNGSKRAVARLP